MNKDYAAKIVQKNMYYRFTSGSYLKKNTVLIFPLDFVIFVIYATSLK